MMPEELRHIASLRRADALSMIRRAGTGHTGGSMSAMDILCALYYAVMREEDRFILSKGHSVEGLYAILADRGYFPREELLSFSAAGSRLIGHPNNKVPGIELCTGALGHGLSAGVGMALGARRTGSSADIYVLTGDGELEEGSVWEAAMAASYYQLDNLCAIVDRNGLQISGTTESISGLDDLPSKWRAFGWDVSEVCGHDPKALLAYFFAPRAPGKPRCLIAHTVKGKGLPCAEGKAEWHHKVPTEEQISEAFRALDLQEEDQP